MIRPIRPHVRLEEIKTSVREGTYEVHPARVAAAILRTREDPPFTVKTPAGFRRRLV